MRRRRGRGRRKILRNEKERTIRFLKSSRGEGEYNKRRIEEEEERIMRRRDDIERRKADGEEK